MPITACFQSSLQDSNQNLYWWPLLDHSLEDNKERRNDDEFWTLSRMSSFSHSWNDCHYLTQYHAVCRNDIGYSCGWMRPCVDLLLCVEWCFYPFSKIFCCGKKIFVAVWSRRSDGAHNIKGPHRKWPWRDDRLQICCWRMNRRCMYLA